MRAGPAAKVATAATAIVAVVYLVCALILNTMVGTKLTRQADDRLTDRLNTGLRYLNLVTVPAGATAGVRTANAGKADDDDTDYDTAPVFLWLLAPGCTVQARSSGAPQLASATLSGLCHAPSSGLALDANAGPAAAGSFRLKMRRHGNGWLVAGQSRAADVHTERLLQFSEVAAAPLVLLAMFAGSLAVGLRALAPVEHARRRQLEFTADASHELRTPLSVISAETDLALSSPRRPEEYREALARIKDESGRLRQQVDNMLWLARFDSSPPAPRAEPMDLGTLAEASAARFSAVARSAAITITADVRPALISAPPEWIDRLAGVLLDNACRYAGPGGQVRIIVTSAGGRACLRVEDSGPGIPESARPRLFDRFHRATSTGPGAGLGLAIGNSVVRTTSGRWRIGDSPLGGALMEVSWRSPQPHRLTPQRRHHPTP